MCIGEGAASALGRRWRTPRLQVPRLLAMHGYPPRLRAAESSLGCRCRALESLVEGCMAFGDYFRGRRVLVTGHTGFKGAWLSLWLSHLGAEVHGLALPPEAGLYAFIRDNTFARESFRDLRERASVRAAIGESRPSLIFHLAAQAIVQASYRDPVGTFGTNALGTVHLLDAVRELELSCDVVIITSDKCYENSEWPYA